MKTCTWCKIEKVESEFNKKKGGAGGLSAHCRECQKKRHAERYAPSKPHLKYYEDHYDKLKNRRDKMRDELNERSRKYNQEHSDKKKESVLKHRNNNLEKFRKYSVRYCKERRAIDPKFALTCTIRSLIFSAFKRMSINGKLKSNKEYGINYTEIFSKIGPRPGTGKEFHLDHIIPLYAFDLDEPGHIQLAHLPCNMRWITRKENIEKGRKIPEFAYTDPELSQILKAIGRL